MAAAFSGALLLAGCAATPVAPPKITAAPRAAPVVRAGAPVLGRTARQLEAVFGAPAAQLATGPARRIQFTGPVCVLDAYLYPAPGGEHAVTHVDTRGLGGEDVDRAACVAALTRQPG